MTTRGTTNGNSRGSVETRRARKLWVLWRFGLDGVAACSFGCGTLVDFETISIDRYPIPGWQGGRYVRGNIRPACGPCNSADGGRMRGRVAVIAITR